MRISWLAGSLLTLAPLAWSGSFAPEVACDAPPVSVSWDASGESAPPRSAAIAAPGRPQDSSLTALYDRALPFPEFLDRAAQRLPEWYGSVSAVQVADSTVARARAVGGRWRVLVVAVDTCGDSLRQVPVVARLAELVHGLGLRVITPAEGGAAVQSRFRSLDGRRATPTFVLLDETGAAAGCIVELPAPLRHLLHERRAEGTRGTNAALADTALAWYRQDAGASIAAEVVGLMEAAAAGRPVCETGS